MIATITKITTTSTLCRHLMPPYHAVATSKLVPALFLVLVLVLAC